MAKFNDIIKEENGIKYIQSKKYGGWYPLSDYTKFIITCEDRIVNKDSAFSKYADGLRVIITDGVKTMATGFGHLYVNPGFMSKKLEDIAEKSDRSMALKCIEFVVMHEFFHNVYNHLQEGQFYKGDYPNHTYQNMAMDYEINGLIEHLFPEYKGCTNLIKGLIKDEYFGKIWTEIYPFMKSDPRQIDFEELEDTNTDDGDDETEGGGDSEISEDYKKGMNDAAAQMRALLSTILHGKATTKEDYARAKEEIKNYCRTTGIPINESNNLNDPNNTWSDDYNNGVIDKISQIYRDICFAMEGKTEKVTSGSGDGFYSDDLDDLTGVDKESNGSDDDNKKNGKSGNNSSNSNNKDDNNSEESEGNEGGKGKGSKNNGKIGKGNRSPEDMPGTGSDLLNSPSAMQRLKDILDSRGERENESVNNDLESSYNDVKKIVNNQIKKGKIGEKDVRELGNYVNKYGIAVERIKHVSETDWKEILSEFVNDVNSTEWNRPETEGNPAMSSFDPDIVPYAYDEQYEVNKLHHIVFVIDTSGSVVGGPLEYLMNEICNILEDAVDDGCIVDVIKHDYVINATRRFEHTSSNINAEIGAINVLEGTGGTQYKQCMSTVNKLLKGERTGYPAFDENPDSAAIAIFITDDDFYSGSKDYDLMIDKCKILIYNGYNTRLNDEDKYFLPSIINIHNTDISKKLHEAFDLSDYDYDDTYTYDKNANHDIDIDRKKHGALFLNSVFDELGFPNFKFLYEEGENGKVGELVCESESGLFYEKNKDYLEYIDKIVGPVKFYGIDFSEVGHPIKINDTVIFSKCKNVNIGDTIIVNEKNVLDATLKTINPNNNKYSPSFDAAYTIDYYNRYLKKTGMIIHKMQSYKKDEKSGDDVYEDIKHNLKYDIDSSFGSSEYELELAKLFFDNIYIDNTIDGVCVDVGLNPQSNNDSIVIDSSALNAKEYTNEQPIENFPSFFHIKTSRDKILIDGKLKNNDIFAFMDTRHSHSNGGRGDFVPFKINSISSTGHSRIHDINYRNRKNGKRELATFDLPLPKK